jgi:putative endonuclease
MASYSGVLYVGITNNLERRVFEHKIGLVKGFTKKYKGKKLLYFEETDNVSVAIGREKQIKRWCREKKLTLIKTTNSSLSDISADWQIMD